MHDIIEVNGEIIYPGEHKELDLRIARLPTYTNIDLPVRIIRANKTGPVILLTGGLHGDEINGIEIVRRLLADNLLQLIKGTVIAIPLMNVYGFIQNVRGVPDGKDINRSFPGSKSGSLAKLVAYTIMHEIIPKIDFGIDFHTGGNSRANFPQIRCVLEIEKNLELAKAFAPPVIIHSKLINKSFRKAAFNRNKHILVYETGESMRFDQNGIEEGINGTLRLLNYLGMVKESPKPHKFEIYEKTEWVRASFAGIYHTSVKLGDTVEKGLTLGVITDPFGNEKKRINSRYSGRVIGINNSPVVHKGDAILHIATNKR